MAVLDYGLIFQLVLASPPYTQTCAYNNDIIITLQNILTLQIFHQNIKKIKIQANVSDTTLKLSILHKITKNRLK